MTRPTIDASGAVAPGLRRRLACAVYEAIVLFGVGLVPAAINTGLARWLSPGWPAALAMQGVGFLAFGVYFVWLWSHGGQTLPMQTWRVRLVARDGAPLTVARAAMRYCWSWLWIAPAVVVALLAHWPVRTMLIAVVAWALIYACASLTRSDRQFLHDVLAGTRLVKDPPASAA